MSLSKKRMRLSLRKRLKPYKSLLELAEDFDLTIPELKRLIREMQVSDTLKLEGLSANGKSEEKAGEGVFELFHKHKRCLVCGHEMQQPKKRDIGWGEFKECRLCRFSAHDMANFETQKKAADKELREFRERAALAQKVLQAREVHKTALRRREALP